MFSSERICKKGKKCPGQPKTYLSTNDDSPRNKFTIRIGSDSCISTQKNAHHIILTTDNDKLYHIKYHTRATNTMDQEIFLAKMLS